MYERGKNVINLTVALMRTLSHIIMHEKIEPEHSLAVFKNPRYPSPLITQIKLDDVVTK